MDTAKIVATVKTNSIGIRESITYEWIGKTPYTIITGCALSDMGFVDFPEKLIIGPYHLLKLGDKFDVDAAEYVRADKLGSIRVFFYRITRALDLIYRRLIITLAVWKLADYDPSRIPSWRNIRLLKRFSR